MARRNPFWAARGSLFAALVDTGIACWALAMAWRQQDAWMLWTFAAFFGALAAREWYAYIHKDKAS